MIPLRLALLCCMLFVVSEAFVEFDKSRLYDEKDFEGHGSVELGQYCFDGCQMYVSVAQDSTDVAKHITIKDITGTATSLYDIISSQSDGRLRPYFINKWQLQFINENVGRESAPIAVWIVRHNASNIEIAEVYDGSRSYFDAIVGTGIRTFLSAEPFSISTGRSGEVRTYHAISAGFDAFGSVADGCKAVIYEQGEEATKNLGSDLIRSPLFTVAFDAPITSVMMATGKMGRDDPLLVQVSDKEPPRKGNFYLGRATFFTSPGYIGCAVKGGEGRTKTYRSSLYAGNEITYYATMFEEGPTHVTIHSDINVEKANALMIVADGRSTKWSGFETSPSKKLLVKDLKITWTRDEKNPDQYFMIRVTSGAAYGFSLLLSVAFFLALEFY